MTFRLCARGFPFVQRSGAGGLVLLALSGCSLFSRQPPLPRHASLEQEAAPRSGHDFAALVANAEILYFPADRAASGGRGEPSARLVEALRRNGAPFALAWDLIDLTQQPLLDELAGKTGAAREELIARLELAGTGRAREHCRAVLRDPRLAGVSHLALRLPPAFLAKLDAPGRLAPEDERQLPGGYSAPASGFQAYTERLAAGGLTSEPAPARSYRGQVASQQGAAETIVRHCRGAGAPGKLLVFLHASDLAAGQGVPRYVAQKLQVRQLVLDSSGGAVARPKLLTRRDGIGRAFQRP